MWDKIARELRQHGGWLLLGLFVGYIVGAVIHAEPQAQEWKPYGVTPDGYPKSQPVLYEQNRGELQSSNFLITRLLMRTREVRMQSNAVLQVYNKLPFEVSIQRISFRYVIRNALYEPAEQVKSISGGFTIAADSEDALELYLSHPERFKADYVDVEIQDCYARDWKVVKIKGSRGMYLVFYWSDVSLSELQEEIKREGY